MYLVVCENNLIRTRSTSLSSFDSLAYSLQTKFLVIYFSFGDVWNGVSTIVANSSMRVGTSCINLQQYRLPLNMKEDVLSDPVNAWKREIALQVVVSRLVAIVFREIIPCIFDRLVSKVLPWKVVPGWECISTPPSITSRKNLAQSAPRRKKWCYLHWFP